MKIEFNERFINIARKGVQKMKIKDLIRELGDFDENLDIEVRKVYRTGRIDKFTIEKIVPCIRKENKETVRAIVRIK